jgi:hypothetical protein
MPSRSDLSGGISLRFTAAMQRAKALASRPYQGGRSAPPPHPKRRILAIGDPQTSLERFMAILDSHEMLGADGYLADDVVLVSLGDHFDYRVHDGRDPRADGVAILRWLAEHAATQVQILFGNHDAARVMELAAVDDDRFQTLRTAARDLAGANTPDAAAQWAAMTDIPTPGLVARDYASFSEAQRALVVSLLRANRFRLGVAALMSDGRPVLLTHAGVTTREVEILGTVATPRALAAALDTRLAEAIAARKDDWAAGTITPLDLAPLHYAGVQPEEGGGLLYHRPSNPDRTGADAAWESQRRRRFHPRELPRGLVQVAGHTGHRKLVEELADWSTEDARAADHGVLRTLTCDGEKVVYDVGITAAGGAVAVLHLIDATINADDLDPDDVPLLELSAIEA